ncbi:MAG: alpha-hydroxy-acid oxidizing protein [Ardenticatenales bacterium]|nr:alpha-hydroxy-acid oxidizing protein [Ardenticatenales bacterium]
MATPAEPQVATPTLIRKVTHYLHDGFHARCHGEYEAPPALGDARWTADLLMAGWYQSEHGRPPAHLEHRVGASGGGFDRLAFAFRGADDATLGDAGRPSSDRRVGDAKGSAPDDVLAQIDTTIPLNRRDDGRQIVLSAPWYGGGMSFGSVSENVMVSRARAAQAWGTLTCTGEGGYPPGLVPFKDNVITQVATGLFGVREETIQHAPVVEFKYAQGAKPGLGGHLLGDKSTTAVANIRESVPWVSLFSPFPFHSVYSVEDHKKHIDWIRTVNPTALISVKVSTPADVDMVAVGSYYAGAHIIHLDGSYGGTGAAPEIAKKNIAMPIEFAVPKVHRHLEAEGIRDQVTLIASGGVRTAYDIAKAIALGADGCVIGTAELVALGCTRCSNCERGRGCTYGLTTTDPELQAWVQPDWGAMRLLKLYKSLQWQLRDILHQLGMGSVRELRGRRDVLRYVAANGGDR